MERVFYSSKRFLNMDGFESDASIFTEIKFFHPEALSMDCSLKIRDCHHSIHLEVSVGEELENSVFKIDTIIHELQQFKEALYRADRERERRKQIIDGTEKNKEETA